MPVAVRLVELLALTTILGVVAGFSIFAVAAQRMVYLFAYITSPLITLIYGILHIFERIMLAILQGLLGLVNSVGDF